MAETEPRPGRYRHFKGGDYEVVAVATHSETGEKLVVYRPLYGDGGWWVRPLPMFLDRVVRDGREVARFTYMGSDPSGAGDGTESGGSRAD